MHIRPCTKLYFTIVYWMKLYVNIAADAMQSQNSRNFILALIITGMDLSIPVKPASVNAPIPLNMHLLHPS